MIVKEELLKKLRSSFNLNIYEAKIWTALLSKGVATAGELSDISGVPRSRSYDVLESLEKRGFIVIKLGKPIKYLAVKPEEIVGRIKKGVKENADNEIEMLEQVRETSVFKEMELLYKHGISHVDHTELTGAIRGRSNLRNQMDSMLKNATKSITIMTTAGGFVRKMEDYKKLLKKLHSNNVKIRVVVPLDEKARDVAEEVKQFVDVKHTDDINARFIIVDGRELMFMADDDKRVHSDYDLGVWVNTPFFANALESMFNTTWEKASKY